MNRISILGCGWLGFPLAKCLKTAGFQVKGSSTTRGKLEELKKNHIEPYLITASPHLSGDYLDTFFQSDVLFLNIPFRKNLENPKYYKEQNISVLDYVSESTINHVVFASSTSVYGDLSGVVSEDSPLPLKTEREKVLFETENLWLKKSNCTSTILRFAGLVGGNRKIGSFLSGKKDLTDPDGPVNLVHLDDCLVIILLLINKKIGNEIINVCCDKHPTRKELYTQKAKDLGLPPPEFLDHEGRKTRIVSNNKLKNLLDYSFQYPDPLIFP